MTQNLLAAADTQWKINKNGNHVRILKDSHLTVMRDGKSYKFIAGGQYSLLHPGWGRYTQAAEARKKAEEFRIYFNEKLPFSSAGMFLTEKKRYYIRALPTSIDTTINDGKKTGDKDPEILNTKEYLGGHVTSPEGEILYV